MKVIPKIQLYAKTLQPLLIWLKDNPDDKDIKYTVARLLRYYSNTPKILELPYMYSDAALAEAIKLEIPEPEERLKWVTWKEQTNKSGLRDVGRKNGIFHLEHIVPISQIAKKLYELDKPNLIVPIYKILVDNFKQAVEIACRVEHGYGHTAMIHSKNIDNITTFGQAIDTTNFIVNARAQAMALENERGGTSWTIAGATGEGNTTPKDYTRQRVMIISGSMNFVK